MEGTINVFFYEILISRVRLVLGLFFCSNLNVTVVNYINRIYTKSIMKNQVPKLVAFGDRFEVKLHITVKNAPNANIK